jgi:hypothetical protein
MPENPTPTPPAEEPTPESTETVDYKAEAEKWKALSRKNEERARENAEKAKKLDEIEEQSKSEVQKAIEAREAAEKRAANLEVKALRASIAASKGIDPELLTGSTEEEITASADRLLAWRGGGEKTPASTSSKDAGELGDTISGPKQLTRDDLKGMTPKEINEARKNGQLNSIMGVS